MRPGLDAIDAVDSILPAGTLSGAPKIRACEIINAVSYTHLTLPTKHAV